MDDNKISSLVKVLSEKTGRKQVRWEELMLRDNVFTASFPNSSVKLWEDNGDYYLAVCDNEGRAINTTSDRYLDLIGIEEPGFFYEKMKKMFDDAKNIDLGVDEAIDSIMAELDKM